MTSLIDIQNQIAILQKQAEEIRAQEFNQTVQDIKAKMAAFGITLADLDAGTLAGGFGGAGAKQGIVRDLIPVWHQVPVWALGRRCDTLYQARFGVCRQGCALGVWHVFLGSRDVRHNLPVLHCHPY